MQGRIGHTKLENWLSESGLEPEDMLVRPLDASVRNALNLPQSMGPDDAAVIPYFGITGAPVAYYRVRLLGDSEERNGHKYQQAKDTETRIYFPLKFRECLDRSMIKAEKNGRYPFVIITEGEKKAACAVKYGIPAIALGGVWSFKNRTTRLPADGYTVKQVSQGRSPGSKSIVIKSNNGASASPMEESTMAEGAKETLEIVEKLGLYPIVVYDTDEYGVKEDVQTAAAYLGYAMLEYGIDYSLIKQLVLPQISGRNKTGLDDYIVSNPKGSLEELVYRTITSRVAFPRFPYPKKYVSKVSREFNHRRKEMIRTALILFTEMEYRGRRYRSSGGRRYYQLESQGVVMPADFPTGGNGGVPTDESHIYGYLLNEFGLMPHMTGAIEYLSNIFSHWKGIEDVVPSKVTTTIPAINGDDRNVAFQIGDNHLIFTSAHKTSIELNGSYSVLFLPDYTDPIDHSKFAEALKQEMELWQDAVELNPYQTPT